MRLVAIAVLGAVLAGCSLTTGEAPQSYDLIAPRKIEGLAGGTRAQLLIREPVSVRALNSERIAVRMKGSEFSYIAGAQWTDSLPKLVQARLMETFERTGRARAVGRPGDNLAIDYQILTEIRAFQLETGGGSRSVVEISVRLLNDRNGRVVATRQFAASVPLSSEAPSKVVAGMNAALGDVLSQIVLWTYGRI